MDSPLLPTEPGLIGQIWHFFSFISKLIYLCYTFFHFMPWGNLSVCDKRACNLFYSPLNLFHKQAFLCLSVVKAIYFVWCRLPQSELSRALPLSGYNFCWLLPAAIYGLVWGARGKWTTGQAMTGSIFQTQKNSLGFWYFIVWENLVSRQQENHFDSTKSLPSTSLALVWQTFVSTDEWMVDWSGQMDKDRLSCLAVSLIDSVELLGP